MSKIKIVKVALGMIVGFVGARFLLRSRKAKKAASAQEPARES